jgi:hypothetical protein
MLKQLFKHIDAAAAAAAAAEKNPIHINKVTKMAKNSPDSTPAADIKAVKPTSAPITVIFCVPGRAFSREFLSAWSELLLYCVSNGIRPVLSTQYSCNIYYSRNMCLGGNVQRGKDQKPFTTKEGPLPYDYIMWIDSDIIFNPLQFAALLEDAKHNDIVSGVYRMTDGNYATVETWDEEYFKKNGHFEFMTESGMDDYAKRKGPNNSRVLFPVSYNGMGFFMVKRGVVEELSYPWFRPITVNIGDAVDFTMEDVGFCIRAKKAGFTTMIDPAIRVAHQKEMLI